jgi:GNAT superfamily N-acetyltransferase
VASGDVEFTVRPATLADLPFIDHLQHINADALAFYPKVTFEREISCGRIILAEFAGIPCGYLWHGAFAVDLKIHQACIEYDLRGQLYGSALMRFLISLAAPSGCHSVTLHCGSDLEANRFWHTMGFGCERVTQGGIRRKRDINHWVRHLQPSLFASPVAVPSERKQDASDWTQSSIRLGNQFLRGKALRHFRKQIEIA